MQPPWIGVLRDCNARYRGRAQAEQHGGSLAVLVKDDGAVIAHRVDAGVSPQFYNPAGEVNTWFRLDRFYVHSVSESGEELRINGIPELLEGMADPEGSEMAPRQYVGGIENDVAAWIRQAPELVGMRGAKPLREEDRVGGRVDLWFAGGTVVEVKRRATVEAHDQARRYARDPEVEKVVIACFEASENLLQACSQDEVMDVVELDRDEFARWMEEGEPS